MSSACSSENACAGLVSIAPATKRARLSHRLVVLGLALEPGVERDPVELGGLAGAPTGLGVDLGDHRVEPVDEPSDLRLGRGPRREDLAREAASHAIRRDVDAVALAVAAVRLEAELGDRVDERFLVGRDPLAADLEHRAVDRVGPQAPADAVARFEHDHALARAFLSSFAAVRPAAPAPTMTTSRSMVFMLTIIYHLFNKSQERLHCEDGSRHNSTTKRHRASIRNPRRGSADRTDSWPRRNLAAQPRRPLRSHRTPHHALRAQHGIARSVDLRAIAEKEIAEVERHALAPNEPLDQIRALIEAIADPARDNVGEVWTDAWSLGRRNEPLAEAARQSMDSWHALAIGIIRAGQDAGQFAPVSPERAALVLFALVDATSAYQLVNFRSRETRESLVRETLEDMLDVSLG